MHLRFMATYDNVKHNKSHGIFWDRDSHMSLCSVEEFNSGLLHLLKTRLQSLHLQEETTNSETHV